MFAEDAGATKESRTQDGIVADVSFPREAEGTTSAASLREVNSSGPATRTPRSASNPAGEGEGKEIGHGIGAPGKHT